VLQDDSTQYQRTALHWISGYSDKHWPGGAQQRIAIAACLLQLAHSRV